MNMPKQPIGIQSDKELRNLRKIGHQKFDAVSQKYGMTKHETYAWLAGRLRLPVDCCHFGIFTKDFCREAIRVLKEELQEENV